MARRKSHWQQFADNFDSVYGTFNTMFSDIEEAQIMRDEVTELQSGIGPGPRSQQLWSYGGKTYDKEITPEMLTGLRNTRLIDNMAKWGDTEGAMKLRQAQATIDASTASTAAQVQQNELIRQQFGDLAKQAGLQNQLTTANIGLTNANKERILATYPVEKRKMIAESLKLEWDNKYTDATFDFQVDEQEAKTSSAMSQAEIDEITAKELSDTSHLRVKSTKSDYLQIIDDNKVKKLENRVAIGEADQKIAVNDLMKTFRDMAKRNEFADDQAIDMRDNYNAHQIAGITHQSTMFKASAMEAYTSGGVEGLSNAINELNGVDDTRFEIDEESGEATIWAVDSKTKKDLRVIVSGTMGEGGDFDMNLQKVLDPASSMAISKSYHDELLVQAEIAYKEALAEEAKQKGIAAKNAKAEFKKDDFLIRLLMEDPNNQMAWNGLLGENMTATQIQEKLREEHIRQDDEQAAKANNLNDGLSSEEAPVETKVVKKDKVSLNSVEEDLKNAHFIVNNAGDQIGSQTRIGSTKYNDAVALIEALTSPAGINAEIKKLNAAIEASLASAKPNTLQSKNKRAKLAARIKELEASLKGIGSGG